MLRVSRTSVAPRQLLRALIVAAYVLPFAGASAAAPPAGQGLVAFWDFDGSLTDKSGSAADELQPHGNPGKLAPRFVAASQLPGTVGQAVALGVSPDDIHYLTATASDDLKLGPSYTIEAWIYPTSLGEWNRLVLQWGGPPNYAYHLALHHGLASHYHGQASGAYLFAEGGGVEPERWQHLAAVACRNDAAPAESTLVVYLNGQAVAATRFDGTIGTPAAEGLGIGDSCGGPSAGTRFHGYVDEIAIWKRALPAEEIRTHFAQRAAILRPLEAARRQQEIARLASVSARLKPFGCEEIVFAERAFGRDPAGHYYANFGYSCTDPDVWLHGQDGGSLCKLNVCTGELTRLVDDPLGAVRDPQVHFDAQKILFSYRKGGTHNYNLYEINVDGSNLRQITSGDWDDVEPAYLPDGDIVFCSSRCKRYIGCWLAQSATLHRCNASGQNLRMLSSGAFTENTPAVLPDGRILYTRWEYVNRDPVSFHHLWTMNPDGSAPMVYFGNMRAGGVFIDAKPIPGSERVALIHSPGHGANEHVGYVATLTAKDGPDAEPAMRLVSRDASYRDPSPLSEELFLVARDRQLLVLDGAGNAEVLYTASGRPVHEPSPLVPRPRPSQASARADLTQATGTVVLSDVYRGRNMAGVTRGAVKKLLVLEDLPKPANFHGGGSQPIGHGVTSTLKRILGTVPVEADGSAHFEVPALRSIYFALLDEHDRSLKQMRSFLTVQPGETVGCVGCHDTRQESPSAARPALLAMLRPPSVLEPVPDAPEILDFPRDIQPILDRHCVSCHGHEKREGGASLVGDRGPVFSHSYYELLVHWQIKDTRGDPANGSGRQPGNDPPYTTYSSASPLMKKIDGSHGDVRLAPREAALIRLWIDVGATYPGTYAAYGTGQVGGCWNVNEPVRVMADTWPSTRPAQEAIQRRCTGCHGRVFPQHVTDRVPTLSHEDMLSWERPLSRFSRHRIYNLSRPEKSLVLLTPLAKQAGGYATGPLAASSEARPITEDRTRPPKPIVHPTVFLDASDPDYQKILAHVQAAKAKLDEIKRFDMPGFQPNEHYVREMKRYGVLPEAFDMARDPLNVYATDEAYWRSLWHRPRKE